MGGAGGHGSTPRKRTGGSPESGDDDWPQTLPKTSPRPGWGSREAAAGQKKPVQRNLAEGFGAARDTALPVGCRTEPVKVEIKECEGLIGKVKQERSEAGSGSGKRHAAGCLRGCCHFLLETAPVPRWALLAASLVALAVMITLGLWSGQSGRADLIAAVCRPTMPCPDHWMWYGGKCYLFSKETRNWDASLAYCSSQNATLSVINTPQEKTIITRFKDTKDYWVGLRKTGAEWRWVDGSPFRKDIIQLKNDGTGLNCAYVNSERLGALDCTTSRHWLCTRDAMDLSAH